MVHREEGDASGSVERDGGLTASAVIAVASVCQRMRWIPPGRFKMGSPEDEPGRFDNEGPRHIVSISRGFWLFESACTQKLWHVVMGANPSRFLGDEHPVEQVSWTAVQEFLDGLTQLVRGVRFDLPTEAQWEYACRAGSDQAYNVGSGISTLCANYLADGSTDAASAPHGTSPTKSFKQNQWGLFDMHGNVWEWCRDGMRLYGPEPVIDPCGPMTHDAKRTVRGGSWGCDARHIRSAYRAEYPPDSCNGHLGFRCLAFL